MNFNTFGYLIKQGLANLVRDGRKNIATFIVVVATMLVLGGFIVILINANYIVSTIQDAQAIQAFIKDDLTQEQIASIEIELKQIKGVVSVKQVSKEQAFADAQAMLKEKAYLLEGMDKAGIFPASFMISIDDISQYEKIRGFVEQVDGVYNVKNADTVLSIIRLSQVVQKGLIAFGIIFIAISVTIISNTIKLAVYSNRKEINIMKYIGATNNFVRLPYIIEGIAIGLVAALISFGITSGLYIAGYNAGIVQMSIGMVSMAPFSLVMLPLAGSYLVLGLFLGIVGSIISIGRYLKV